MVRRPQQDAAQAHDVPRDGEGDDLASTVAQQLVAAGPAELNEKCPMAGLALMGELLAPLHPDGAKLHVSKTFELGTGQGDECVELLCEHTVGRCIWHR